MSERSLTLLCRAFVTRVRLTKGAEHHWTFILFDASCHSSSAVEQECEQVTIQFDCTHSHIILPRSIALFAIMVAISVRRTSSWSRRNLCHRGELSAVTSANYGRDSRFQTLELESPIQFNAQRQPVDAVPRN
jgi:hypothetical protein